MSKQKPVKAFRLRILNEYFDNTSFTTVDVFTYLEGELEEGNISYSPKLFDQLYELLTTLEIETPTDDNELGKLITKIERVSEKIGQSKPEQPEFQKEILHRAERLAFDEMRRAMVSVDECRKLLQDNLMDLRDCYVKKRELGTQVNPKYNTLLGISSHLNLDEISSSISLQLLAIINIVSTDSQDHRIRPLESYAVSIFNFFVCYNEDRQFYASIIRQLEEAKDEYSYRLLNHVSSKVTLLARFLQESTGISDILANREASFYVL